MATFQDWAVYRICADRPKPNYQPTKKDWDFLIWFVHWAPWYLAGRHGTRPDDAPLPIPKQAWDLLAVKCVHDKYKAAPPKPPDPPDPPQNPPSRWKDAPWCKPHVDISYGLRNSDRMWTPEQLANRAKQFGAKAIGFQIGSDSPDPDWAYHGRQLYEAAHAIGLQVYGWGRADYVGWDKVKADIRSVMPLDGYSADVESRCNDQQLPEHLRDEFADEMPLSVVATGGIDQSFDGLSPNEVAVRWGDYFDYRGQDYYKADLPLTPDMGENFVYWRSTAKNGGKGFRHLPEAGGKWHVPLLMANAEGTPPLAQQAERAKAWVRSGGVLGFWIAELLEANDEWAVYADIVNAK